MNKLKANFWVNLKYFGRNRVLHVSIFVLVGFSSLFFLGSFLWMSKNNTFYVLSQLFNTFNGYIHFITCASALFYMHTHLTNRSLKMIFTKPCSTGTWIAGVMAAPLAIAAAFYALVLIGITGALLLYKIPLQSGFFFMSLYSLAKTLMSVSIIIFLTMLMHPVLAIFSMWILSEQTFYYLTILLTSALEKKDWLILKIFKEAANCVYYVVPLASLYSDSLSTISSSMRVSANDWAHLSIVVGYALTLSVFCFFSSTLLLKRKNLT